MAIKRADLWYYGTIGDKEYNSGNRIYSIIPDSNSSKEKIVIMGYQIGTGRAIKNGEKPNEYIEDLGELQIIYKYINEHSDLEISWKWKKTIVQDDAGGASSPNPADSDVNFDENYDKELYKNNLLYKHEVDLLRKVTSIDDEKFDKIKKSFKNIYKKNKDIYLKISIKTGIPARLIAAIHYRESSCNFNTYLHNGDPLGKKTVNVPKGIYFDNFLDSAIDVMTKFKKTRDEFKLNENSNDIAGMLAFAEKYNGLGYYKNNRVSPYVFSGTNVYQSGKYTSDGKYSSTVVDKQPGVDYLINSLND